MLNAYLLLKFFQMNYQHAFLNLIREF